jgi:hypothetical protein
MNVSARRILDDLCDEESCRVARLSELVHVGEFSEELKNAIEEKSAQQRWGCVCRLIWAVQRFPNRSLVPVLTSLLDAREDYAYLEAVVDALIIIPDDRAVESLKRALALRVPGDDLAFHFNKKVAQAIPIGDHDGIARMRTTIVSTDDHVSQRRVDLFHTTELKTINYSFRQTARMVHNQNHNRLSIYEGDHKAHAEPERQVTRC